MLALIYHITNYATKGNYSQYQRIMAATMVKKTFEDLDIRSGTNNITPKLDKFILKRFNRLFYHREVNEPLVASFLFGLPDHYFSRLVVKTFNIELLKTKFELILSS